MADTKKFEPNGSEVDTPYSGLSATVQSLTVQHVAVSSGGPAHTTVSVSDLETGTTSALRTADQHSNQMTETAIAALGEAMSRELMSTIAIAHPDDRVVMFLVDLNSYLTAKGDSELLERYDALYPDERAWITDIVRGACDENISVDRP